jgi:hypothetical protein
LRSCPILHAFDACRSVGGWLAACRAMIEDAVAVNHSTPSQRWRNAALLCGGSAFFFWQLRHPIVRLASPALNELVGFALGLGLPWLTVVAIFLIGRWWSKAVAIVAVPPLLLYTFVFLLGSVMTGFVYENGRDLSFDRFAETQWKGSDVRFYRTNGGATTDFGVVIRQERTLFPGMLLVRRVDDFYPCYSLDAHSTDCGITITDKRADCRSFPDRLREYRLKPFVYF